MATVVDYPYPVGKSEIRTYPLSFADDLRDGVTVTDVDTLTHTPPDGSGVAASTPTASVDSPLVNVTLGPLTVTGWHVIDCLAELSDGDKSALRLRIHVEF